MITKELAKIKQTYEENSVEILDGLYFSQPQTIKKIEYYWDSKYINGQRDEIGRIKPFYNITKFRVNVATRATDLDIKDIRVYSDNPTDRVRSMLINHEFKNWAKEANLAKVLNDFGKTRAKYGGVLLKKVEKKGELKLEIVEWKNVITDQTNIQGSPIIELHYMTPAELSSKKDVWDNVDKVIKAYTDKQTKKDNGVKKICVMEAHGKFPESVLKEGGSQTKFKQMHFIVSGDYVLFEEEEKESPYKYLAWDNVAGRGLGVGIVEDGFEAQMWINDAIIAEKNVMDLAGKVYIKTNATSLGQNILTDSDNGQIFELKEGEDMNLLNLVPNSLPQFQNLVEKWNTQYERATNTFEAVTGETLPANTPLGSVAIQSAQASSFFDYRREEAGIFWTEVIMKWIIPVLIKKINKEHILSSDFSPNELQAIDKSFSTYHTNDRIKQGILEGNIMTQEQYDEVFQFYTQLLKEDGKRRYIDIPKGYFSDFEDKLTVDITGETRNKQTTLQTLDNILAKISANPMLLQDPNLANLLNEILEVSGINFIPIIPQTQPVQTEKANIPENKESALTKQTESVLPASQQ